MRRYGTRNPALPWSALASVLTGIGCASLLAGLVADVAWALPIGAVLLCAGAVGNIDGVVSTRRAAQRPGADDADSAGP